MLRFEHEEEFEGKIVRKTIVEDSSDEDINEVMDIFIKFLKGVSYNNCVILNGLEEAIEAIKDEIKEDYIMSSDDVEE